MYLLLCSLFVNELWGSSSLFPFLLLQLHQESHAVPAPLCFLQIFCVYTYASIQFSNLAAMSYDRYVAICCPLLYHTRMTSTRVALLILFAWFVVVMVLLSFSSYFAILRVTFRGSGQTRQKALSTCTPHLLALLNFSCGCFFEVIQNRFDMSGVPDVLRIVLSLYFLTCPPLFNPLLYGLNVTQIRIRCQRIMCRSKIQANPTGHHK
ncbi:hypothetical protein WMY93_005966 [Mugilogobius chulae]|uniref:G-protein coupled receptors family 1 profile domain-containing protein n=1 Tax=Mugilogobius chulae TaxID=88201 RepID=A0AAW0PL08_9GOBI